MTDHSKPENDEPFKTRCPLPTPYERELLTILVEECAEVQQRATKLLRFGATEIQPGQTLTNVDRLSLETGDLRQVLSRLAIVGLIDGDRVMQGMKNKEKQLAKYMQERP